MLLTVLVFIFVLGILVLVHELGHFLVAKKLGIKVEEFGFGLPPKIFGKKIGETVYSLNLLPIGGFVKLYGEEEIDRTIERYNDIKKNKNIAISQYRNIKNRAFFIKKPWQRALVLLAGVVMNFLLGWAIISFLFTQGVMVPTERVRVEKVLPETPAEEAGIREGDIINKLKVKSPASNGGSPMRRQKLKIEDDITILPASPAGRRYYDINDKSTVYEIKSPKDLVEATKKYLGEEIVLMIQRGKERVTQYPIGGQATHSFETLEVKITPRKEYFKDQGPMGVVITNFEERVYPWYQAPFLGFSESFRMSWRLLAGVGQTLWKIITFQSVKQEVAGPLGIAQLTGEAVKFGKLAVLEFLGLLSINLAVINILPFPALDGGRLLFVGIEGVTGRKLRPRWEKYVHQIGMAILLGLILLVTINDLLRIVSR